MNMGLQVIDMRRDFASLNKQTGTSDFNSLIEQNRTPVVFWCQLHRHCGSGKRSSLALYWRFDNGCLAPQFSEKLSQVSHE
jgi:hypothetical protein